MKRFFNLILGALAMLVVALTSAFITMRLAIHGREVKVPNLAGLSISDAGKVSRSLGLRLNLENRFYSSQTAPGRILAQSPAPGITVRRQSGVRVTESLGPQRVSIPDLMGQSERTASINIRRLSLDLGTVASMGAPGEADIVLGQTPNPNASGVDRPRVSLLLSQPEELGSKDAFVMPSLTGLSLMSAASRASAAGLRVVSAEEIKQAASASTGPPGNIPSITGPVPSVTAVAVPGASTAIVVAQTPLAGYRVAKGDPVRLMITYQEAIPTALP